MKKESFIMNKTLFWLASFLGGGFLFFLFSAWLVGASCRYELSIDLEERNTFLTCYRGKVVLLHTKKDENGQLSSKWKVEARQLKIGSQVVFFVYSRTRLSGNGNDDYNDRYNQISDGYKFLFYYFIRKNDALYIFQEFPEPNVYQARVKGKLDFFDN